MFNKSKKKNYFPSKGERFFHDLVGMFGSWSKKAKYDYCAYHFHVLNGLDYFMHRKNKETPAPLLEKNLDRVLFDGSTSFFHGGCESRFSFVTIENARYLVEKSVMPDGQGRAKVSYETAKVSDHYKKLDNFVDAMALCGLTEMRREQDANAIFIDQAVQQGVLTDALSQNGEAITVLGSDIKKEVSEFAKKTSIALVIKPDGKTPS